ncbi:thiamine pyrophosphate-binding protein [Amphiplicatus metriothermophilus]|uniref:Acetolactate synthase, large subunit n=1 Tax=Amphiplicatus metriothermophilus TaxID=1519374 RepID=A0A239PR20_9PROT|nr:thiamine pyrophosphate-binding protein [Amphiplicatus metriothermophilus]MBB5518676.1 acetolactate synthase-1/2/3 large subunit [Amphiplicatus metriothermophilus]SNT72167.1 acetolactate synthase, large subunit [Amphiplicatus metriothermophilus]
MKQSAARHIVDALIQNGATHVFCVPGESYLAVLDALHDARDRIRLIACRHEAAAANMAEAYGKLTGRPGVVMVTRGPGATQGSVGLHTAYQDSTPMIMFIGQVARGQLDREAFQEIDYRRMLSSVVKWAGQIDVAARAGEYVNRAFATAANGRPGPVALALPEDMLVEEVDAEPLPPAPRAMAAPDERALELLREMLGGAERPLLLVGGGGWTNEAVRDLKTFVEATGLPVAASFRAKDLFDNLHPQYAGDLGIAPNPKLVERVGRSDLIIAFGPRLGEMTTSGYTALKAPLADQMLVHVHPGAEELGRVYTPMLAINAAPETMARALAAEEWTQDEGWLQQAYDAHADFEAFSKPIEVKAGVNLSEVFSWLDRNLPDDAIMCNGAGNYAAWLHRFYRHKAWKTQLAPTSGAMGYGFPAALAAKAVFPQREVVCAAGDGCFMMAASELATAMQYDLPVIVLVANNASYGTIRMHQERDYPGRVAGTDLVNPDFAAFARSFGAHGATVTRTEDFPAAFEDARKSGLPAVIELKTSVEEIAPGRTIAGLRARS